MAKGLFFCLPSVSVSRTLTPVLQEAAMSGFDIVYYNTNDFKPAGEYDFRFKPYPSTFKGYYSDKIDGGTSYFDFGNILIDSAETLLDFLIREIEIEKPDLIIHSHLAVWGKLIARFAQKPAVTLYTTFVLDKRIMFSFQREQNPVNGAKTAHVNDALRFHRKYSGLYKKLGFAGQPDLWDVYINKGKLNLSFILPSFQPQRSLFGKEFQYLGYPTFSDKGSLQKRLIYVSMGTIMNKDISFFSLIINVLKALQIESVIAVGNETGIEQFGEMPPHIRIVGFADQRTVLQEAKLFITRGGMASVHEAVYSRTPMIAVPLIPEQQITAVTIEALGIGVRLSPTDIQEEVLRNAINEVLTNDRYQKKLDELVREIPGTSPEKSAIELIKDCLYD